MGTATVVSPARALSMGAFFAREGFGLADRDARIVGPELVRLGEGGEATPRKIVDAARDESSPLHPYFAWDDRTAADKYRHMQARQLVKAVMVVITDGRRRAVSPAIAAARIMATGGMAELDEYARQDVERPVPVPGGRERSPVAIPATIVYRPPPEQDVAKRARRALRLWHRRFSPHRVELGELAAALTLIEPFL